MSVTADFIGSLSSFSLHDSPDLSLSHMTPYSLIIDSCYFERDDKKQSGENGLDQNQSSDQNKSSNTGLLPLSRQSEGSKKDSHVHSATYGLGNEGTPSHIDAEITSLSSSFGSSSDSLLTPPLTPDLISINVFDTLEVPKQADTLRSELDTRVIQILNLVETERRWRERDFQAPDLRRPSVGRTFQKPIVIKSAVDWILHWRPPHSIHLGMNEFFLTCDEARYLGATYLCRYLDIQLNKGSDLSLDLRALDLLAATCLHIAVKYSRDCTEPLYPIAFSMYINATHPRHLRPERRLATDLELDVLFCLDFHMVQPTPQNVLVELAFACPAFDELWTRNAHDTSRLAESFQHHLNQWLTHNLHLTFPVHVFTLAIVTYVIHLYYDLDDASPSTLVQPVSIALDLLQVNRQHFWAALHSFQSLVNV